MKRGKFRHLQFVREVQALREKEAYWRATRPLRAIRDRLKPWGVIAGGTDCDGMRWASTRLYWTRAEAERAADDTYAWADGPTSATVVAGRAARRFDREYEPDTRDRFAERMGY